MSNSTNDYTITSITTISLQLNRYITLFVFLFGTTGHLLNILVLLQKSLIRNICVLYFLGSSVASLGIMLIGLPSRIIAGWTASDPTDSNPALCKIRIYLLYTCRTVSYWLLVLATLDRWFLSSNKVNRRLLSSRKMAFRGIATICSLSSILWIESIFCYNAYVEQGPIKCYGKSNACRIFNDIVYASSAVVIPSLFMLIFGLLTIHNIRRSYQTVQPITHCALTIVPARNIRQQRFRRKEISLTFMLLLQITLLTFCSVPQAIHQFYLTFTIDVSKTPLRKAIENFIVNFNFSLTYVGNGIPFYIYTLNGTVFRQTLRRLIQLTKRKFKFYLYLILARLITFLGHISCFGELPVT